jgi:uncharacterized protein (TIGR03435 family)
MEAKSDTPANVDQLRQMLRALLSDRFKLVVRTGTKDVPVYSMIVGKKGSKLLEWKDGAPMPQAPAVSEGGGGRGGGGTSGGGSFLDHMTMQAFAERMTNDPHVGRPVLDKTDLQGLYLVRFRWDDDDTFVSAVEEATGLKFEAQKAPMEFLTIDHVERPTQN